MILPEYENLKTAMDKHDLDFVAIANCIGLKGERRGRSIKERMEGIKGHFSLDEMILIHSELFPDEDFVWLWGLDDAWFDAFCADVRAYAERCSYVANAFGRDLKGNIAKKPVVKKTSRHDASDLVLSVPFEVKREISRLAARDKMDVSTFFCDMWKDVRRDYLI